MKLRPKVVSWPCLECGVLITDPAFKNLCQACSEKTEHTIGFWHNKHGANPKLICFGTGGGQISDAIKAFSNAYPKKSLLNLTLTFNRTIEEYEEIMREQGE